MQNNAQVKLVQLSKINHTSMIKRTTLLMWLRKRQKTSPKGTLDRGAATNSAHRDPWLEITPTGTRTRSQAMLKSKAKGHFYEQTILVQYVVSTGTILTTVPDRKSVV